MSTTIDLTIAHIDIINETHYPENAPHGLRSGSSIETGCDVVEGVL